MGTGTATSSAGAARAPLDELLPALRRLDERLALATARARIAFGADAASDRFRGLYISESEVGRLLAREPGAGAFHASSSEVEDDDAAYPSTSLGMPGEDGSHESDDTAASWLDSESRLGRLARAFELATFDVELLVMALAPELDLRYERLYAYLQDDVTRRRPTLDLALTLLCDSAGARLARRAHVAPDAPLMRHRLIRLAEPTAAGAASTLAATLEVDEQILLLLLGHDTLGRALSAFCTLEPAGDDAALDTATVLDEPTMERLTALVGRSHVAGDALQISRRGPDGSGRRTTARAIAAAVGAPLLTIDSARLDGRLDAESLLRIALRTAWLHRAIVLVLDPAALPASMRDAPLEHRGIVMFRQSEHAFGGFGTREALEVPFGIPSPARRRALWRRALARRRMSADDPVLDALSHRFRITTRQIDVAVARAATADSWSSSTVGGGSDWSPADASRPTLSADALFAAARAGCGIELEALATRIAPRHAWTDLVLPADALDQLRELCVRVACRDAVVDAWGFGARLARGGGVNALFSGPSGTGKTMAAEVIAGALGVDLFRIDLAGIVSKYIGETEKNLDRVFAAAEHANGILFFDEADALFGKRSEVHDSHDRYANIEISYLLQKMEQFEGVAILATNLRGNLDDAFVRRLAFAVHFPFPDVAYRERIWRGIWLPDAPVDPAIDVAALARQFPLSGGHIRNVAVAAAFHAAGRGSGVELSDVLHAVRREYQKLGKTLTDLELGAFDAAARREWAPGAIGSAPVTQA
jgi:AAA+ superfamily predicted ATPase